MSNLILYYSKYGATKRYAEWIAEELAADIKPIKELNSVDFSSYENIIIGSGVYANGLKVKGKIIQKIKEAGHSKIYVFGVGASPVTPEQVKLLYDSNFSKYPADLIKFYLFRGKFNLEELNLEDKMIMGA